MKQLTGLDASFLNMETASSFGHVSSLSVYERPDDPDFKPFEAFRAHVLAALPQLEPFRRRLVQVPFGLDHPYWVADPAFDLDFHLRHQAVPAPGDDRQLADQVARIISRPMDRHRPLWEVYVFEGLADGNFAVLTKVHHATIDGASGVELLGILLDTEPTATPEITVDDWKPERVPSSVEMFNRTMLGMLRRPEKTLRLQLSMLRQFGEITRNKGVTTMASALRRTLLPAKRGDVAADQAPPLPTRPAPRTPFNRAITPHRRFAYRSASLADIKALKAHLGATVNDVVMAACAGALRRYLDEQGVLPSEPLVAMIPVSIRTGDEADRWTNRVSGLIATLPTHIADPIERVSAVHATMEQAKADFELIPADVLVDLSQLAPPALAVRATRIATSMRIADRMNPPVNLVISNVPGPRQPLYLGGALLKHYYPVSTVAEGQGLNVTVQSYRDTLDFGLVSCRELVPDLWHVVDLCVEAIDELFKATGIEQPSKSASPTTTT
jgi:WS/DGAT/MGAT family acyltransferase